MHPVRITSFKSEPFPAEPTCGPQQAPQQPLILVIDDSRTIRSILQVTLERAGYRVQSFADGIAAMRWLSQPGSPIPDLVILDVALPWLDGFTVAHRLKSHPQLQQMVILMLSRHSGVLPRLKARLVGASAYLVKPVPTQDLLTIVAAHLGRTGAAITAQSGSCSPSSIAGSAISGDAFPH